MTNKWEKQKLTNFIRKKTLSAEKFIEKKSKKMKGLKKKKSKKSMKWKNLNWSLSKDWKIPKLCIVISRTRLKPFQNRQK